MSSRPPRVTLQDILERTTPAHFSTIEATMRDAREQFNCPPTVPNHEAFYDLLFQFFCTYQKAFFNADWTTHDNTASRHFALEFIERQLLPLTPNGRRGDLFRTEERNSITGRDGGAIKVINDLTDAVIKLHTNNLVRNVISDLISANDYDTRLRIAKELEERFGKTNFPGEALQPHYITGMHLEEFATTLIMRLHAIRRDWQ